MTSDIQKAKHTATLGKKMATFVFFQYSKGVSHVCGSLEHLIWSKENEGHQWPGQRGTRAKKLQRIFSRKTKEAWKCRARSRLGV